jgi:hypothetical protein
VTKLIKYPDGPAVAIETARALATTAYKAAEDIIKNDKICAEASLIGSLASLL